MDPLVRQTSLEILLQHYQELAPQELREALTRGLTDPDLEINEIAWGFVRDRGLQSEYQKLLLGLAEKFLKEGNPYSVGVAATIMKAIKRE